jgi:hypothetical protein
MSKCILSSGTVAAINTFRGTAKKYKTTNLRFASGITDQYSAVRENGKAAVTAYLDAIVAFSLAADKADAKENGVIFAEWELSRHSRRANLSKDLKIVTRFLDTPEYFDVFGYEPNGEGLKQLIADKAIVNGALWDAFYYKNTAKGKATAKANKAARKAKAAKAAAAKDGDDGAKVKATPAEYIAQQLIRAAAAAGIDVIDLHSAVGDVLNEFLGNVADEKVGATTEQ